MDRDRQLVNGLSSREPGAPEELFGTYRDRAYRLALRITRSAGDAEEVVVLRGAIDGLPPACRAAFVLRDVDGLSNVKVSEVLGLSVPSVKSRVHRARLSLRARLADYMRDPFGGTRFIASHDRTDDRRRRRAGPVCAGIRPPAARESFDIGAL